MSHDIKKLLDAAKAGLEIESTEASFPHTPYFTAPNTAELSALIDHLTQDDGYANFDNHLQMLGDGGSVTSIDDLARWLVARACVVDSKQAISELDAYQKAKTIDVEEVMLLASLRVEDVDRFDFCNGVSIAQPLQLPNHSLAVSLVRDQFSGTAPLPRVHSVLFASFEQEVFHENCIMAPEGIPKREWPPRPIEALHDARLCLSLARGSDWGVHAIATGTVAGDHLPFIRPWGAWNILPVKHVLCPPLIPIELNNANRLLGKFCSLDPELRSKLRVPMERLNNYGSSTLLVDKAIELRVCLDSLFGDVNLKDEITFRISLRAAQLLGETDSGKEEIQTIIKKAYGLTSKAVHNGILAEDQQNYLNKASALAQKAIRKIIEDGGVDWKKVELGLA